MSANLRVLVVSGATTTASTWLGEEVLTALRHLGARAGRFTPEFGRDGECGRHPIRWSDWDVVLAIVEAADDAALEVIGTAVAQGKRVVAFAEREDAMRAAAAQGGDVVRDLATSLYRVVMKPA